MMIASSLTRRHYKCYSNNVFLRRLRQSSSLCCRHGRLMGGAQVLEQQHRLQQHRRSMAIYAVGEGWTGALCRKNILTTIDGHFDEDVLSEEEGGGDGSRPPVLLYPHDDVKQAAAGWGCSIFLDTKGKIHTVGRPQDLMTLFRLRRMPKFVRDFISQHTDPSETTFVGSGISKIIGWASGKTDKDNTEQPWDVAREYSLLHDWTEMEYQAGNDPIGDTEMTDIVAGPGFMAMIGTSGTLYTLGINSRGQCGVGMFSNNIWTPQSVKGITDSKQKEKDTDLHQDQPVRQVALGFQHGYALTRNGQVYSWGKTQRGQLGRDIQVDQDPTARPIKINDVVTQISSSHHHGVALTAHNEVYIWGKNMKLETNDDNDNTNGKPIDVATPERLEGMPIGLKIEKISSGSHHTAMLMEDGSVYAIGVASDEPIPLLNPVLLVEPGILELPIRQFDASHDRTTIIDNGGNVYQVHLWKDKALQEYSLFTPGYVDYFVDRGESIQSIHRGWRHTLIITAPN